LNGKTFVWCYISLSVANFCLRKIAQLHQKEFDKEVIETVNRDMYVDDTMKSTCTTEKAISLASQLQFSKSAKERWIPLDEVV